MIELCRLFIVVAAELLLVDTVPARVVIEAADDWLFAVTLLFI